MSHLEKHPVMKKSLAATLIACGLIVGGAGPALADPDFGPGNSQKGPHDPGAKCHPPGQTVDEPGCK
ncbi:hypothetical protein [Geodermatophilus sp. URMC 64]